MNRNFLIKYAIFSILCSGVITVIRNYYLEKDIFANYQDYLISCFSSFTIAIILFFYFKPKSK